MDLGSISQGLLMNMNVTPFACHLSQSPCIFTVSGQTSAHTGRMYFLNIFYAPKIANLGFFNFKQILSSQVRQLHYNTNSCRSEDLRRGCFSIRFMNLSNYLSHKGLNIGCDKLEMKIFHRYSLFVNTLLNVSYEPKTKSARWLGFMFEAICLPQAWKVPSSNVGSHIPHTFTG